MYDMHRFADKVAVVTGGAKGIGRACCLRFAAECAQVAVLDVALAEAEAVAAECQKLSGRPALALACNVVDQNSVSTAMAAVMAAWNHLDILVASAGVYSGQPLAEVPLAEWQKVIGVDLTGVFLCNQAAAPIMMQQGSGSIINISSMAGKTSWAASAQYSAAKSGVIGLTRSVAQELACHGANCNAVCPGNTETDMVRGVAETIGARDGVSAEEWLATRAGDCPMGRFAKPAEIAGVVAFLASEDAAYINGQAIEVDGGMVMS